MTAWGFPDGTWFAIPGGPPRALLELPPLVSSHIRAMVNITAIVMA